MTEENKRLLLKDLSARLSYGVICDTPKGDGHLCSIEQTIFGTYYGVNVDPLKRDYFDFGDSEQEEQIIKPYLRPMSSMTEEEREDYEMLQTYPGFKTNHTDLTDMYDWLNEKMFDYRGLIEKGLALEAPMDMYKTE